MNRKKMMLLQLLVPMFMVLITSSSSGVVPPSGGVATPIQESPLVPGRLIVSLTPGTNASDVAMDHGLSIAGEIANGRFVLLGASPGQERQAAGLLNADARVEFAEPDWLRRLHDVPNDNDYSLKWDLNNDGTLCDSSGCATAGADMDWQEAYSLLGSGFNGSAVVAVIDTGIDFSHPDLDDKIIAGYNYYDYAVDPDPTDTYGHGTHVAGIVLAETNNTIGTAGVGYGSNISVMPLRVGAENGLPTSAIVNAIYHAVDNGADVINMSLGGRFGSSSEQQAINYAWNNGLIIVASSGNGGSGKVSYPAAFTNCIAVGSTNWHDRLAPYSNKGGDLDVVAPGGSMVYYGDSGGIYSTMPTYDVYLTTSPYAYSKNYDQLQGTSMSAPQVSGLAALLFAIGVADENGNGWTNDEIRDIIETTTDDLGKSGWDREYGWGRINVYNAVLAASGGGSSDSPPNVSITYPADGDTISGTITITADATDDNDITQVEFFVDDSSIGTDTNGLDGWSAPLWDTTASAEGPSTITATATDTASQTASDSIIVTVDNIPSADIGVTSISPSTMPAGTTLSITITGSGFVVGADVALENGAGPTPTISNIVVVGANTITATITVKNGGPRRDRVWDVRVTNLDGSFGILSNGFTVTP